MSFTINHGVLKHDKMEYCISVLDKAVIINDRKRIKTQSPRLIMFGQQTLYIINIISEFKGTTLSTLCCKIIKNWFIGISFKLILLDVAPSLPRALCPQAKGNKYKDE